MITVYLEEGFDHLDEGYAFNVDEMELWTSSELGERQIFMNQVVKVLDRFEQEYYVHIDIVQEMSDRVA